MLKTRLLTALVLLTLFLGALFTLPPGWWRALVALVIAAGAWEWARLAGLNPVRAGFYVLTTLALGGGASLLPFLPWRLLVYAAAAGFWLLLVPLWLLRHRRISGARLLAAGWLVLVPAGLALVDLRVVGTTALLALMSSVWIADTGAYFAGRRYGRHKLAPSVSPGKTWEGVAGGLAAVVLFALAVSTAGGAGLVSQSAGFPVRWVCITLLFVATAVVSILGDLFESSAKRQAGVKDSGNLLPGHGGILDRIDSLTAALPLALLLILVVDYAYP